MQAVVEFDTTNLQLVTKPYHEVRKREYLNERCNIKRVKYMRDFHEYLKQN